MRTTPQKNLDRYNKHEKKFCRRDAISRRRSTPQGTGIQGSGCIGQQWDEKRQGDRLCQNIERHSNRSTDWGDINDSFQITIHLLGACQYVIKNFVAGGYGNRWSVWRDRKGEILL